MPRLDGTPGVLRTPAPKVGQQNNDEIHTRIGYSGERLAALRKRGVI